MPPKPAGVQQDARTVDDNLGRQSVKGPIYTLLVLSKGSLLSMFSPSSFTSRGLHY